jgi:hypothetical protein
MKVLD